MIEIQVIGVDALGERLRAIGAALPKVMARAINRAIAASRTKAKRDIAGVTGLKPQLISRRTLSITRARPDHLRAVLTARESWIPLFEFLRKLRFKSGLGIAGLTSGIATAPPGAFFASVGSGHKGAFKRAGPRRLPIRQLPGPPIPRVILERGIFEALKSTAGEVLDRRLEHELDRLAKSDRPSGGDGV